MLVGVGDVEVDKLQAWVAGVADSCGDDLWRVKGVVAVRGCENKYVLQGVHKLLSVHSREDSRWVEHAPANKGGRRCQIVLIGRNMSGRRAALEASATAAFGFPLKMFNEELQGPDPHAMPDLRPMALVGLAAAFISADGALAPGGMLDGRVPEAMAPLVSSAIAHRWEGLVVAVIVAVLWKLVMAKIR